MDEPSKECTRCQVRKPLTSFHKHRRRPGGLASWCKACVRAKAEERKAKAERGELAPRVPREDPVRPGRTGKVHPGSGGRGR